MKCIVHIGHGKTGSSFIQSNLAINTRFFENIGYKYPSHPSFSKAKRGLITSGNGELLLDDSHRIPLSAIYSNENLFAKLANNDEVIERVLSRIKSDLVVVIYTRDLFELAASYWGQSIKRGKGILDYKSYIDKHYGFHFRWLKYWISASEKFGFDLKIYNYSRHKHDLWKHFVSNALSVEQDIIPDACQYTVNRSLTIAEYELQRLFNKYSKVPTSSFVSDSLVNNLPQIRAESPYLEEEVFNSVVERFSPIVSEINQYLEGSEEIVIESFESINKETSRGEGDSFLFSGQQLEELVKSLSVRLNTCQEVALQDDDANYLRDMAVKIEQGRVLRIRDAFKLMMLAKRARPNGPFIKKKIDDYKLIIDAEK